MIVVAALAVSLGIGIVSRQAREPILRELLKQQTALLKGQIRIQSELGKKQVGSVAYSGDVSRIKQLEDRVSLLESQLKGIQNFFKQYQAAAGGPQGGPPPEDFDTVHKIDLAHSYIQGNTNAPVTIVEFMDFECPFCSRFHQPLKEVLAAYPNDVRIILKNFPLSFHQNARPAAKAALAAGVQGKYYEMADRLLDNQKSLSDAKYLEIAKEIGLDVEKFSKDLKEKDAQWEDIIQKDMKLGTEVGVRGTPTFYINGKKASGRDFNYYKSEVDKILAGK